MCQALCSGLGKIRCTALIPALGGTQCAGYHAVRYSYGQVKPKKGPFAYCGCGKAVRGGGVQKDSSEEVAPLVASG